MLLTYTELTHLLDTGVVRGAQKGHVNGASIDLCLGSKVLVEAPPGGASSVVDLMDKATPPMREVDLLKTGYYDLAPLQFCLASSLETFFLTNDLAAEFKLKSSLARAGLDHALAGHCFTGDTEIPLMDGTTAPIEHLVGKEPWVYAMTEQGEVVPAKAKNVRKTREVAETVTVLLDSEDGFTCTPDHLVMLRNGSYKPAGVLVAGKDTLMPFLKRQFFGYEQVYCPRLKDDLKTKQYKGRWAFTHRQVATALHGDLDGLVAHHIDHCPSNNLPENIEVMTPLEHISHHNGIRNRLEKHRNRSRDWMKVMATARWKDPEKRAIMTENCRDVAIANNKKRWANEDNRKKASDWNKAVKAHKSMTQWIEDNPLEFKRRVCLGNLSKVIDTLISESLPVTADNYIKYKRQNMHTVKSIEALFGSFDSALEKVGYTNHVVMSVSRTHYADPIPVYDMEVPEYHNFAIGTGVFVHNCDPGWHGSVLTLELVNNLRWHSLRLRPGMKIGQVLFFRGHPTPDHASYAAQGQYNGNQSVQASLGVR